MTAPLLTALVSTYRSERYLQGCLDDLLAQTLGDRLEIVVVDAASPEREGELVAAYMRRHANVRYLRTEERVTTSVAFDLGTGMARGRYLTNANTDDRHHPEFGARLCAVLEQCPQFGIAYADSAINTIDNETWHDTTAERAFAWPHYTPAVALSCCLFGPQPVWRTDVHAQVGGWSREFTIANDQEMFLRIARARGAVHVDEVLGLFLQRPDSVAGRAHQQRAIAEACAVFGRARRAWDLAEIVPGAREHGPDGEAAAWFELGNLAALGPYTDGELALQCWQRGAALPVSASLQPALRAAFANNAACVLLAAGASDGAQRAFARVPDGPERQHNAAWFTGSARPGTLRALRFAELSHAVVAASRESFGVRLDARGRVQWTAPRDQRPWDVFDGPNGVPWTPPHRALAMA